MGEQNPDRKKNGPEGKGVDQKAKHTMSCSQYLDIGDPLW